MLRCFSDASGPVDPVIIAELGAKYAPLDVMKEMVRSAAAAGVDAIKFQTFRAETIATPGCFFTFENGEKVGQFEYFKRYELTRDDHVALIATANEAGVAWLSTPSHAEDVALLEELDPPAYKTGSDDLTNLPLLELIARQRRPMIVSTGMATLAEIERALEAIARGGAPEVVLLHCVVSYPSRPEDANLRAIETLRRAFGVPVGLSDHTTSDLTSVLATALGAVVIEKHFTLDHAMKLPDHEASLDPAAFRALVERVRLVPKALGDGKKHVLATEEKWRGAARKSVVATRAVKQGEMIRREDVAVRRPSGGIEPQHLELVVGRAARCDIEAHALLTWSMV